MPSPDTPDTGSRPNNFGPVAGSYEKHRSQYPAGIGPEILSAAALPANASLLEIGSGTGRATRLFTGQGFHITCIEPVAEMAAMAREVIGAGENVTYIQSTFEDWSPPPDGFDMAFSGQAFHWVDPEPGYLKLAGVLRPGGTAALFWYTPALSDPDLVDEVDRLYAKLAPEIGPHLYQSSRFDDAGEHLDRTEGFGSIGKREYRDTRIDTTEAWLAMLRTTSDHMALPETQREELLRAIGHAIDRRGRAEVSVITRLWLAARV